MQAVQYMMASSKPATRSTIHSKAFGHIGRIGLAAVLAAGLVGCQSSDVPGKDAGLQNRNVGNRASDPGTGPWVQVPRDRLAAECGLDPDKLDAAASQFADTPVAVVRHGKLCWSVGGDAATESYHVFSATKTLSALVLGVIAARTQLKDTDDVSKWLSSAEMQMVGPDGRTYSGTINPQAKVAHILAMTGASRDLSTGKKDSFSYDSLGSREINRLIPIMDRAVQRSPEGFPGLVSAAEVARRELFIPLGMNATTWPGGTVALSAYSSVHDLARLGLLMLNKGRWNGRQIIDEDYIYRLSHAAFEDSNTGYGYLTWLNADGADTAAGEAPDPVCTPYVSWQRYPHPPTFEAQDNGGASPFQNLYDIGSFKAVGLGGQIIYVHRGLDMVIAIRNNSGDPQRAWTAIRPALVALDPKYKGDEAAFCDAYRRSAYAPDLNALNSWDMNSGHGPIDDRVDPSVDTDPAPPSTGPLGLEPHRNNIGIGALISGGANFDRTGTGYLDLFYTPSLAVVRPGDSFTAQGFTYTLPAVAAGQPDNIVADGQTIFPATTVPGASKLGLLGAGYGGSTTGGVKLNYADGSVLVPVFLPDWIFDSNVTPPASTVLALSGLTAPLPTDRPSMWSVTVPLDPKRQLKSITLPHHVSFHIFDLQIR